MVIIPMKEGRLVVAMDDLDFRIRDVAFEAKVFNKYGTFDQIANRSMEGCAYLHCDLLNEATLTTITLRMKSPHVKMHEQHLQKGMFVGMENFGIESKSKKVFEKCDMHFVITIESTTIVSSIPTLQHKLVPMFFHMDSIREFKSFIQSWRFITIVVIIISIRGVRDSRGERLLLIEDGEGEFDPEYEQLFEAYNGDQCAMVLIKNVTITPSKGDQYLKAQHYTILTKVVNGAIRVHL
jgi:hypothetical protein